MVEIKFVLHYCGGTGVGAMCGVDKRTCGVEEREILKFQSLWQYFSRICSCLGGSGHRHRHVERIYFFAAESKN
jgi:hypothetical protein